MPPDDQTVLTMAGEDPDLLTNRFRYLIVTTHDGDSCLDIMCWCQSQIGEAGKIWTYGGTTNGRQRNWHFLDEDAATQFALIWT